MDKYAIVKRPLVTEQGTHLAQGLGHYPFEVHPNANKTQVKQAIEQIYNVKVDSVRTANYRGKPRRRGRIMGHTSHWKKAIVVLDKDSHIDLF
jgi:large subunit ribosomal protein L23